MDDILHAKKQLSTPFSPLADSFQIWQDSNNDIYIRIHEEGDPGQNILYQLIDEIYGVVPWQIKALPDGTQAITLNGTVFTCTPTQNTTWTVSDGYDGQLAIIKVNNTGGHQITFSTGFTDIDSITDTGLATKVIYYDGSTWRDHKVEAGEAIYPTGTPELIGHVSIGDTSTGYPRGIAINNNYAYLTTAFDMMFYVYDIADPTTPTLVGSVDCDISDSNAMLYPVILRGNIAFVLVYSTTSNNGGIISIDISDPSSPSILHSYQITGVSTVSAFDISENWAYIVDWANNLRVIDISNPSVMVLDNSFALPTIGTNPISSGIKVERDVAFIYTIGTLGASHLAAVDVSDPTSPSNISQLTLTAGSWRSYYSNVCISGKYLYLSHVFTGKLHVIDISDPSSMSIVDNGFTNNEGRCIEAYNGVLFSSGNGSGLRVINITDPLDPVLIANVSDTTYLINVFVFTIQGNYAYCLCANGSSQPYFSIVDLKGLDTRASTISAGHIGTGSMRIINDMDIGRNANIRGELFAELLNWSHLPALPKIYIQSAEPTLPEGSTAFWKDTDDSKYYLLLNITGTQKKVELT